LSETEHYLQRNLGSFSGVGLNQEKWANSSTTKLIFQA
jgi:hypothetical protein